MCCCSPELSHDEIMKLKLIYKNDDPSYGDIKVLHNLKNGTVKQMNPHYYGETQFKDCRIVGQKQLIYWMFNNFANENVRVIYLKGGSESGKSTIAKFFGNYLEERHKVSDVKYLNMENTSSVHVFSAKIMAFSSSHSNNVAFPQGADSRQYGSFSPILIILDNLDLLLGTQFEKFRNKIFEILETTAFKFLITSKNHQFLAYTTLSRLERTHVIPKLNNILAAKMLVAMRRDLLNFTQRNPYELAMHPIFFGGDNTPRKVSNVAFLLSKGMDLDEVLAVLGGNETSKKNKANAIEGGSHHSSSGGSDILDGAWRVKNDFIYEMKENEEGTYNLLVFCTLFTNGLLTSDIEYIGKIISVNSMTWLIFITRLSQASSVAEIDEIEPADEDLKMLEDGFSLSDVLKKNFVKNKKLHKMWIELKHEVLGKGHQIKMVIDPTIRKIIIKQFEEDNHIFWTLV